ncbi:DUF3883 domain-containing protein [Bacillus infantis]|uniref:DUF3883 domain-containing protein n=1 Tax=Bacillus infantis TaxID=324767 RepID=UPI001CD39D7E|nr:DUF3883 domain-containing protein [Bacillus infantis]MCA1040547.1 DUF3883 domain-containing protein [Bacillus infantis]
MKRRIHKVDMRRGNSETYLKMSVINAFFTLKKYIEIYPDKNIKELIDLIKGIGSYVSVYDYENAESLFNDDDNLKILDKREYIYRILTKEQPSWLYQVPFGRELVASSLKDNEYFDIYQCFDSVGLFNKEIDMDTIEWWDSLSSFIRKKQDSQKIINGRIGELLTIKYETEKLSGSELTPKWVSIENNLAGYDVLSYKIEQGSPKQIMIEVKTCSSYPVSFYITRNEWKIAQDFGENYIFYVWFLPEKSLHKYNVKDIESNIPINRGSGSWKDVLIEAPLTDNI